MVKEETVNVTLTLPVSQVAYLDDQAEADFDGNRSQAARRIIRKDMQINAALGVRIKAKTK